ncbi:TetR/AcrR family transcriptional regulator C-terminal domain-containing protein [Nonomuraea sp. NPDC047529]|uniref:TetR/AcrR family transcriptional regulator C-terminal domain-containing protein n=1 Tax=Nonomuraea sp. NPDC047529 TaxID=3155623 RepID=UPI0034073223
MSPAEPSSDPPFLRITAELRRRVERGELRQGDLLPSTRQIVREFGVAMATATKVLTALRQAGLARPVPGVGTVVDTTGISPRTPHDRRRPTAPLDRDRIVSAGLAVANAEGLPALSMRRLAADLDVTTMALYRHISGREQLILLMADAAFGEFPLPEPLPSGWRRRLETAARQQWAMYQRHPWLAQAVSFTRPLLAPRAMVHSEWVMRALDGLGLDPATSLHIHVCVAAYVRGVAAGLESEAAAAAHSGITDEQWMDTRGTPALMGPPGDPAFPNLALVPLHSLDLDTLFEFGLHRLLEGIVALIGEPVQKGGREPGRA